MNVRSGRSRLAALALLGLAAPLAAQPFAYVPNYGSNNVPMVDTATVTATATIALPGANGPCAMAANTARTRVQIGNFFQSTISVNNTGANAIRFIATPGAIPGASPSMPPAPRPRLPFSPHSREKVARSAL